MICAVRGGNRSFWESGSHDVSEILAVGLGRHLAQAQSGVADAAADRKRVRPVRAARRVQLRNQAGHRRCQGRPPVHRQQRVDRRGTVADQPAGTHRRHARRRSSHITIGPARGLPKPHATRTDHRRRRQGVLRHLRRVQGLAGGDRRAREDTHRRDRRQRHHAEVRLEGRRSRRLPVAGAEDRRLARLGVRHRRHVRNDPTTRPVHSN